MVGQKNKRSNATERKRTAGFQPAAATHFRRQKFHSVAQSPKSFYPFGLFQFDFILRGKKL
jgi:hypothetical protein